MSFVWFWTFWHWSRENHRDGVLLRGPLQGIGSHWDEWYRHEASAGDREAIGLIGRDEGAQRRFVAWIFRRWAAGSDGAGGRLRARFALGQLARQEPFSHWPALERYRESYGVGGVSAVVLADQSKGEARDVRPVEAIVLPPTGAGAGPVMVAEGFEPDGAELGVVQQAAAKLLEGPGLWGFLGLWLVGGCRPGSRWWRALLAAAWVGVGGVIVYLLVGPDPQGALEPLCAGLLAVWSLLVAHAVWVVAREGGRAWAGGRRMAAMLRQNEVRVRMDGGLHLQGASAGLSFSLNVLLALFRGASAEARGSWLWQRTLGCLQLEAGRWAATGVVTGEGWIKPVVLDSKLRACVCDLGLEHIITPRQEGARQRVLDRLAVSPAMLGARQRVKAPRGMQMGFAAGQPRLELHDCGHLAQVLMTVGRLTHRGQLALNVYALAASVILACALPDLLAILAPPPAPAVVAPSSASPYFLWVSLETRQPESFRVRLDSDFWANRLALVKQSGSGLPPRAEMPVQRLPASLSSDGDNGTVWIERRRSFLGRDFFAGECVGRYPLTYVTRLTHE